MTTHPASVMEKVFEQHRPLSHPNSSVARNGHNCNLPTWVGFPVSLDPRNYRRAEPGLIVHCEICDALWKVVQPSWPTRNGPDLLWVEQLPRRKSARSRLLGAAIDFNEAKAWTPPDPTTIDWSGDRPLRPNGREWWQMEFEQMLGHGTNRCASESRTGHKFGDGPWEYTNHHCVLKVSHQGVHESPDSHTGGYGWS